MRTIRKPRFPFVQTGQIGQIIPIHRSFLAAGETIKEVAHRQRFVSLPITKALAGATYNVWFFSVPIRLVWPEFPEWLMDTDGDAYTQNLITAQDYRFFDASATGPDWVVRAYELIVNNYFRTSDDADYVYDPAGDLAYAPIVDQTFEAQGSTQTPSIDETVDVSSGVLSMAALAEARAKMRYEEKRARMSDRYMDFLKAQGVRVTEQMASMPEMIGYYRKFIWPQKAIDQSTGFTVQSYVHDMTAQYAKPRYLQEHSVVLGLACLRPKVMAYGGLSIEREFIQPERVPQVGQLAEHKKLQNLYVGATEGQEVDRTISDYLYEGQTLTRPMTADAPVSTYNPATMQDLRYPVSAWSSFVADKAKLSGDDYCIDGVTSIKIATPLKR